MSRVVFVPAVQGQFMPEILSTGNHDMANSCYQIWHIQFLPPSIQMIATTTILIIRETLVEIRQMIWRQNGRHYVDDIYVFKYIILQKTFLSQFPFNSTHKYHSYGPINKKNMVLVMAWRRISDKPLPETMIIWSNGAHNASMCKILDKLTGRKFSRECVSVTVFPNTANFPGAALVSLSTPIAFRLLPL